MTDYRLHPVPETVDHPPHYRAGAVEVIDVVEAFDLGFSLGNVVKYVLRSGRKTSDGTEDLEKALWYLQREIARRGGRRA